MMSSIARIYQHELALIKAAAANNQFVSIRLPASAAGPVSFLRRAMLATYLALIELNTVL